MVLTARLVVDDGDAVVELDMPDMSDDIEEVIDAIVDVVAAVVVYSGGGLGTCSAVTAPGE